MPFLDIWHEKRETISFIKYCFLRFTASATTFIFHPLMTPVNRKKEHKPKNTSSKSTPKPLKPKHLSRRRKKLRRRNGRKRRPPQKHWRERPPTCSSLYRSKKCRLAWIQRRCCVYSINRAIARKGGNANSATICRWRGKGRRKTCIRIRGKTKMRLGRRMIWLTGTKVGQDHPPEDEPY